MDDVFLSLPPEEQWHVFYYNKSFLNGYPNWDVVENYTFIIHMPGCAGGPGCDTVYFNTIFTYWLQRHNMTYNDAIEYVERLYNGKKLSQIFPEVYKEKEKI
jgi:hypothetical protein